MYQLIAHNIEPMDHVRQNEIQGRNMVFFKEHAYSISFCLTWSMGSKFCAMS